MELCKVQMPEQSCCRCRHPLICGQFFTNLLSCTQAGGSITSSMMSLQLLELLIPYMKGLSALLTLPSSPFEPPIAETSYLRSMQGV